MIVVHSPAPAFSYPTKKAAVFVMKFDQWFWLTPVMPAAELMYVNGVEKYKVKVSHKALRTYHLWSFLDPLRHIRDAIFQFWKFI